MKIATRVHPLLSRACKPTDCAAAKVMLCKVMPRDKTRGNTSALWMKNSPDGLSGVSWLNESRSCCETDGSEALLCILFLYDLQPYMMPNAVVKAANELKDANIIVDVLIDFDVANFKAFVMAAVVVAFESVASW